MFPCCCMFSSHVSSLSFIFLPLILHPCFYNLFFFCSPVTSDENGTDAGVLAAELICFQLDTKQGQKQLINQSLLALRCAETTDGTDDFSRAAFCQIRWQQKRSEKEFVKERLQRPGGPWESDSSCKKETHQWQMIIRKCLYLRTVAQWSGFTPSSQSNTTELELQTYLSFLLSVDVCVPAFIKPNISLPLNPIKPLLLIKLYRYLRFSLIIGLLVLEVNSGCTFTDSLVLIWPIYFPFWV